MKASKKLTISSNYSPAGDQPNAIKKLCEGLKSKKFNYIGTINPVKLTSISGSLVAYKANGVALTTLASGGTAIVELLFIAWK